MTDLVRNHYNTHPYPQVSLLASIRRCDSYALNLTSLWARFNGELLPPESQRLLLAGCGAFSPYPFSIANPQAEIIALDLSEASLARARLHLRLHGCSNVNTVAGDLLRHAPEAAPFHFIDAFGVIHHMSDPLAGLAALANSLVDGGILRLMVYSKGGRGEIESIRRALRLLRVTDEMTARRLLSRAPEGSRVAECLNGLPEARNSWGFSDAFLHPSAMTFRIDELLEMTEAVGLTPLLFAHPGAVRDVAEEVLRLRGGEISHNYLLYLGKRSLGAAPIEPGARLMLNPVLQKVVAFPGLLPHRIDNRLGFANPALDNAARRFLRRFREPVAVASLSRSDIDRVMPFHDALFLVSIR
ncbi:class I SAM-dependent methyltransferase [Geobacter pelophilus]|uniref:Class I SAM-dependent methyltransferase n=1 Tax=Geoanaerobacter pelophilus TaxID=60036 RepID=A0AAW4L5E6_9BACT|nr:class I SAM-dependent methyltransferase [Geoanaerobacter pelophilus]MBT0663441.1 class I SAM-dependent methyltransferase [Geoanaerobacter pelophilus]